MNDRRTNYQHNMVDFISKDTGMYKNDIRAILQSLMRFMRLKFLAGEMIQFKQVGLFKFVRSKRRDYLDMKTRVRKSSPKFDKVVFSPVLELRLKIRDISREIIRLEKEDEDRAKRSTEKT